MFPNGCLPYGAGSKTNGKKVKPSRKVWEFQQSQILIVWDQKQIASDFLLPFVFDLAPLVSGSAETPRPCGLV